MSTRTTLRPQQVIPSAQASPANTGSMAASITSAPTVLQGLTKLSYSVSWTGTSPVGTLGVNVSNDCTISATGGVTGGTWNALPLNVSLNGGTSALSYTIAVTGNSGNGFIDIESLSGAAVQLVYTFTSGTGTLTATVKGEVA